MYVFLIRKSINEKQYISKKYITFEPVNIFIMKKLFFVYISIFIFSLTLIINTLRAGSIEEKIALSTQTEQLSETDETVHFYRNHTLGIQSSADEGITVPHGRRFGLNKTPKTNAYSHHSMQGGKRIPIKLSFAKEERHFIQYLTTRHSQGFYIYSLKELLL